MSSGSASSETGPVVFAYDGSELAGLAIDKAGLLLGDKSNALVLCVWQPFDVGFTPPNEIKLNADEAPEVRKAAESTAAAGVARARANGFEARGLAIEAAPIWKGIIEAADDHGASLIVIGSHSRGGLAGAIAGSVARAVASHSRRTVLITHRGE
jgi:nucleotide-binding universal stress UspA family protein